MRKGYDLGRSGLAFDLANLSNPAKKVVPLSERAIYVVTLDVPAELDDEFNRWLDEEHIPGFLACTGFLSCTRFRAEDIPAPVDGRLACRYLNLYEIESPRALLSDEYLAVTRAPSPWTLRMRINYQLGLRQVYSEIGGLRGG